MWLRCRPCGCNMSDIQPHVWSFRNIWCRSPFTICTFQLSCLALTNLCSEVLMNLLHCYLDLICIKELLNLFFGRFPCKQHPGIYPWNLWKQGTLCWLRRPIICGKYAQREPIHPVVLLMVNEHRVLLSHTGLHLFCLTVCLHVESCQHPMINPQMVTYLPPKSQSKLWSWIGNNC